MKADGNIIIDGGVSGVESKCRVEAGGNVEVYGGVGDFLKKGVKIEGKLEAGGNLLLDGNGMIVKIDGAVECGGDMVLRGNIEVGGKVESEGRIDIFTELGDRGLFKVGGRMRGKGGVFVAGNLEVELVISSLCGDVVAMWWTFERIEANLVIGAILILKGIYTCKVHLRFWGA